jgi:hypothetical protein
MYLQLRTTPSYRFSPDIAVRHQYINSRGMGAIKLKEFPTDVLLYLLRWLSLADVLSFLSVSAYSTCTSISVNQTTDILVCAREDMLHVSESLRCALDVD